MFSLNNSMRYWLCNKPVNMRLGFNGMNGIINNNMGMSIRSGETARNFIGGYRGAIQIDGYEVYETCENAPGKRMIGCWAHDRRKFVEAMDESKKHASEALVYIGKLYGIEKEMREANLDYQAIQKRRQEESQQKKTLTIYYRSTGRHYPLISTSILHYRVIPASGG